jgi:pyridinium-3,5-biscarboxylic acid mononucleotide sulfurtransferase
LSKVERVEEALHRMGLAQVRVRHYEQTCRIEVDLNEISELMAQREQVVAAAKAVGYRYVTLDLEGFRSGNLNS